MHHWYTNAEALGYGRWNRWTCRHCKSTIIRRDQPSPDAPIRQVMSIYTPLLPKSVGLTCEEVIVYQVQDS